MSAIVVAIDGPSGVGKSTVSRLLAERLKARYVDTGAMYRAVALGLSSDGINVDEFERIEKFLASMKFSFEDDRVILNNTDLTKRIREPRTSGLASKYSMLPAVRKRLVWMQKEYARFGSVVMEGRDITTVVLPEADIKFFLTASPEVRARRRQNDEKSTDERNLEEVVKDINARDERDTTRKESPLLKAVDAIEIDTGELSAEEVLVQMMNEIDKRGL